MSGIENSEREEALKGSILTEEGRKVIVKNFQRQSGILKVVDGVVPQRGKELRINK